MSAPGRTSGCGRSRASRPCSPGPRTPASALPSCDVLDSEDFCGHPGLRWRLLPSTSPAEPAFEPDNYWRGPVWPVINWLLWQSLNQLGYSARADEIRSDSLSQIAADGEFGEYFEPFTGKQLGSAQQSWTAAVTLDWTASEHDRDE